LQGDLALPDFRLRTVFRNPGKPVRGSRAQ
jgi:hypothetical protein